MMDIIRMEMKVGKYYRLKYKRECQKYKLDCIVKVLHLDGTKLKNIHIYDSFFDSSLPSNLVWNGFKLDEEYMIQGREAKFTEIDINDYPEFFL